jgi:hypothetical protein
MSAAASVPFSSLITCQLPCARCFQVVGCIFWQAAYITINPAYRRSAVALLESSSVMLETQSQRLGLRHAHHAVAS